MSDDQPNPVVPLGLTISDEEGVPSTIAETDQSDEHALIVLQFSAHEYRVNKDASGSALIVVTRTGNSVGEASIDYATKDDTARAGIDYTSVDGTLKFTEGEIRKPFIVPIIDNLSEGRAIVKLELSNPKGAKLGSPIKAELAIMSAATYRDYHTNLFETFKNFFASPNTLRVFKHICLALSLIICTLLLSKLIKNDAGEYSQNWRKYLNPTEKTELEFPKATLFTTVEEARLEDQLRRIRDRIGLHLEVMEFYYTRYFIGIVTFSITAALAAIALIIISKRGWDATNEYIITMFFIMTAASVFYGSWPGVFKQEQNITDNKILYLKYVALENELLSYVATNEALNESAKTDDVKTQLASTLTVPETDTNKTSNQEDGIQNQRLKIGIPVSARDFIHYVDLQLSQDNIAIGFDYSKVANFKNAFTTE